MDKYTKGKVAQQFNRNSDIKASENFKDAVEDIALAHALSGNMDNFMLMTNTIAKVDAEKSLIHSIAESQKQTAQLGSMVTRILDKLDKKKTKK
tara:strand:- start:100 stop:381 length:282 start_codon:yes stop_codon:yes gene_type:complete